MKEYHVYEADDGRTFDNREECLKYDASLKQNEWNDKFVLLDADCDYIGLYQLLTEREYIGNTRYIILKDPSVNTVNYLANLFCELGCPGMGQDLGGMILPERYVPILAWDCDNDEWYDFMEPYTEIVSTFRYIKNYLD